MSTRLRTIGRKLEPTRHHRLVMPAKVADKELQTPEHRQWRLVVCRRAGWRCEWINEDGSRCAKAAPEHRMIADHIRERHDGGALVDTGNGQCLCVQHNTFKGVQARAARARGG
jgi:hypothetical protein